MLSARVIPCLLLKGTGLVKTTKFKNPVYIGDSTNAVRIFNKKEVDELIFLDITATKEKRQPPIKLISQISDECFMPLAVGGGIKSLQDAKALINAGAEKIIINTFAVENPEFIQEVSQLLGNQSVVVSIDAKKNRKGKYEVMTHAGTKSTGLDPVSWAKKAEKMGAGEIMINSIDKDGTMAGYDLKLTGMVSRAVGIPVIACGGAGKVKHFIDAVSHGASAVAAGSFFVFFGSRRAVLINFPTKEEIKLIRSQKLKVEI